jgi:hypothetical protein
MKDAARVLNVDVLDDLRIALAAFADESVQALDLAQGEIRRLETWLAEQLSHWQTQVRHAEEEVFLAKQELTRRKMMDSRDRPVDTTDQEKALQKARARQRQAEDKVETTRNWVRQLGHELEEYEGPARGLKSLLEGDIPRACELLERKAASLEAYLNVVAPGSAPAPPPAAPTAEDRDKIVPAAKDTKP